jgi:hypothetical protein
VITKLSAFLSLTTMIAIVGAVNPAVAQQIIEGVDPINDTKSAFMFVGGTKSFIGIGCQNVSDRNTLKVMVYFTRYIGSGTPGLLMGGTTVDYRFDRRPPKSERWYSETDFVQAQGDRAPPIPFILEMKRSTSAHVRATSSDGSTIVDAPFVYSEPASLIETVLVKCGYNPDGTVPRRQRRQ